MTTNKKQKIAVIDDKLIAKLIGEAKKSTRKRTHYRFHEYEDKVQRMVNVLLKGTYITPHKHHKPDKIEHFICIKGKLAFVNHNENGSVEKVIILSPKGPTYSVEVRPNTYHMFVCLKQPAVMVEIVEGPYDAKTHKNFAPWAPKENNPESKEYLSNIEQKIREITGQ